MIFSSLGLSTCASNMKSDCLAQAVTSQTLPHHSPDDDLRSKAAVVEVEHSLCAVQLFLSCFSLVYGLQNQHALYILHSYLANILIRKPHIGIFHSKRKEMIFKSKVTERLRERYVDIPKDTTVQHFWWKAHTCRSCVTSAVSAQVIPIQWPAAILLQISVAWHSAVQPCSTM